MDFTLFERREIISPLLWLGRKDWLNYNITEKGIESNTKGLVFDEPMEGHICVKREEILKYPVQHWQAVKEVLKILKISNTTAFWFYTLSKSLANGPKLFKATMEQCEAFENTELHIPFDLYRQPYPVIIIEIPKEYKRKLAQTYNLQFGPSHVFSFHDDKINLINVSAFFHRDNVITHYTPAREKYKFIEDSFIQNNKDIHDPEFEASIVVQRLAMNFCMMMTTLGVNVKGPVDPNEYYKRKKKLNKKDPEEVKKAKNLLNSTVYEIQFSQNVKFYEEEEEHIRSENLSEEERKSPKVHWRRGHWRMQACGPKLSERKAIFVKPILVRGKFFVGDLKNTSVTYEPKEKK